MGVTSRCAGTLEMKHLGEWRPVKGHHWTLKEAAVICQHLDCGPAVSVDWRYESPLRSMWMMNSECIQSESDLMKCITSDSSSAIMDLTCSGEPVSIYHKTVKLQIQKHTGYNCDRAEFQDSSGPVTNLL